MATEQFFFTSAPSPTNNDEDLVNDLKQLYTAARGRKMELYDKWVRNWKLVNNTYGASATQSSWAPSPKDSEIYPVVSAIVAWLTDQQVALDYSPVCDPGSDYFQQQIQLCNDLSAIMFSNWMTEGYNAQVKLAIWDSLMFSVGILKTSWDNSRAGGYGNATLTRVDPWAFYPDPDSTSMNDMEYCVEVKKMSFEEVERRFPASATALEAKLSMNAGDTVDRPDLGLGASDNRPKTNPGPLNGAATRWASPRPGASSDSSRGTLPSVTVYEFWLKENAWTSPEEVLKGESTDEESHESKPDDDSYIIPTWRVVVVANGIVLLNEQAKDIYSHGQHPYERFVFEDVGEFYGISLVDHLAQPQIYINRLLTAYQQNTELTGNPVLLEAANSGTTRTGIINKPGQRVTVRGAGGMQNKPEWMSPPMMSADVMNLIQFWISRMENISGLSAVVRGATPTNRNSEGVMSSVQEAAFVRIRSVMRNLEESLTAAGRKLTDIVIDNYNEARIVGVLGPNGQLTAKKLSEDHFMVPSYESENKVPLNYIMSVAAGSTFPTSRQARIAEADKLFVTGAIDRQALLEVHQYPNIPEIIKRVTTQEQMQALAPSRAKSGRST